MSKRVAMYPIDNLFLNRTSPRAMSGKAIAHEQLLKILEAGRWAPSSYNAQPWRFIYAHRETPAWENLFSLLVPFNQLWVTNAAVLVAVVSKKTFEFNGKPSRTHSFDAGAAWMSIALQGYIDGFVVHGMEGFDYDKALHIFGLTDDYCIDMMFAIGVPGLVQDLPEEMQKGEEPSDRKPLQDLIFEGKMK